VADLKLAITEAATFIMGGERRQAAREEALDDARLFFRFDLGDDALTLDVSGDEKPTVSAEERELSLALIKATVDSYEYSEGLMRLTKLLDYTAE
jgi:hypothetical protein